MYASAKSCSKFSNPCRLLVSSMGNLKSSKKVNVVIVYPTDPLGIIPGGTDTCIRDILRFAPSEFSMSLVGVTNDEIKRPVKQWTECEIDGNPYRFFPLLAESDLTKQSRIPLSLRFTLQLFFHRNVVAGADVIQLNRIEPTLGLIGLSKPKIFIIHQNMEVVRERQSDIRWKYFPAAYFLMERFLISRARNIFIVREDAVEQYRKRFPAMRSSIHFLPTWMNPKRFYPATLEERKLTRSQLKLDGQASEKKLLIFVGRLDHQKDPLLLIRTIAVLLKTRTDWHLMMIGDGVLRSECESLVKALGLLEHVDFSGALAQDTVAKYMRSADLLVLTSVYEGMPRCVVEGLGSGTPVVSTNAGEVGLLIENGKSGFIVDSRDPNEIAGRIQYIMDSPDEFSPENCLKSVSRFRAESVLQQLFASYRDQYIQ